MRPMQTSLLVAYLPFRGVQTQLRPDCCAMTGKTLQESTDIPTARTGKTAYLLRGSCDRLAERFYTTILHIAV